MVANFSKYELEQLKKLPPEVIMWASKYPIEIINVAESLDDDTLPHGYVPKMVEVYYDIKAAPSIFVHNGVLEDFDIESARKQQQSISMMVDNIWVYIEVEGNIVLNKLGGIVLPNITVDVTKVSI